ncbi:MAG: flagellar biosynthesis protein FliQ [Vulcanibacillus sp.]
MTENYVIDLFKQAVYTVLIVSGPMLILALLVGLLVSIFQATTQIQEQTLAFVPKIVTVLISLIIFGPWILSHMIDYTLNIFNQMSSIVG